MFATNPRNAKKFYEKTSATAMPNPGGERPKAPKAKAKAVAKTAGKK